MTATRPRLHQLASALLLPLSGVAWAQSSAIYTCVDAQGRRITSDRPIAACMDREQRELAPSGRVRRVVPPVPTADERAAIEAKQRAEAAESARANDQKRQERALLSRYPNEAAHQRERAKALESVDAVDHAIQKRIEDLGKQRAALDDEMAFYAKDPSKAPPVLQRKLKDNASLMAAQQTAQQQQASERQRVNDRFDAELEQLRQLWARSPDAAPGR